ncbi:hypothetical protein NKI74_24835 [Mesorhizobium sp. M0494]|uniref:hypothetical protein n=1 Tax=Mesorhizobium sp. M0494 TaxID=2956951 RepID=UPI003339B30F
MIAEGGQEHSTGFSGNRLLVAPTLLEFVDEPSLDVVPHRSTASEFQMARRLLLKPRKEIGKSWILWLMRKPALFSPFCAKVANTLFCFIPSHDR